MNSIILIEKICFIIFAIHNHLINLMKRLTVLLVSMLLAVPMIAQVESFDALKADYPKLMAKHLELRVPVIKGADVDIPYSNIFFVDINEKHKLRVSTRTQQFISSMSYEDCQKWLLTDKRFLECHYRIIVNMDRIAEMLDEDFLLDDGRKVPISHRKRKEAK